MAKVGQHRHGIPEIDAGACAHGPQRCPHHFTELSTNALLEVLSDRGGYMGTMNHLIGHGWAPAAMATWGALLGHYGVGPDVDRASIPADVLSILPHPVADELRRDTHPWYPIMTDFVSAAVRRDGARMGDALARFAAAPDRSRADMSASVLLSAFITVAGCPRSTPAAVHLHHMFGSAIRDRQQLGVLDLVVALADACARDATDIEERLDAIGDLEAEPLSAAAALALTAFGGTIDDPAHPVVMMKATGGAVSDDDFLSHDMLSWRDAGIDPDRDVTELAACVAVRIATARERGDDAGLRVAVEQTRQVLPADCRSVRTVLVLACYGSANFLGVEARRWGSSPWLGPDRWDPGPDRGVMVF